MNIVQAIRVVNRIQDQQDIGSLVDGGSLTWNATSGLFTTPLLAARGANSDITSLSGITGTITSTLGTKTINTPAWTSSVTWNDSGTTFTHLLVNVTNTASGAASRLMDLRVGGSSVFNVDVTGQLTLGTPLAITSGGTGASSAVIARTNLGLVIGTDILSPAGDGSGLTNLNASALASGTVPTARLGSGTANSTTFLRGDNTWATPPTTAPGGSTGQLQYNNSGAFGAASWSTVATSGSLLTVTQTADTDKPFVIAPKTATVNISTVAVTSKVATITTSTTHGFIQGRTVTIAGATTYTALNATSSILSVPSTTTFTVTLNTADTIAVAETGTAKSVTATGPAIEVQDQSGLTTIAIRPAPGQGNIVTGGGNSPNNARMTGNSYFDVYSRGRDVWNAFGGGGLVEPWLTFTDVSNTTAGGCRIAYRVSGGGGVAADGAGIDMVIATNVAEMLFYAGGNSAVNPTCVFLCDSSAYLRILTRLVVTSSTTMNAQIGYSNFPDTTASLFLGTNTNKGLVLQTPQYNSTNTFELQQGGGNTAIGGITYQGNWWIGPTAGSTTTRLLVSARQTTDTTLAVQAITSQTGNLLEARNSGSAVLARINKDGYHVIKKTSAIADADLSASEMTLWLDDTVGAAKLMIKAKDSAGTVVTGSVSLT